MEKFVTWGKELLAFVKEQQDLDKQWLDEERQERQ